MTATDLVPIDVELAAAPANLFGTDDPDEVVAKASAHATALARVIEDKGLAVQIRQSSHVRVEGWTLLGSMLGVFPVCVSTEEVEIGQARGFKATVEARTRDGSVVGRADALCLRSEQRWRTADDYALLSMAQTRATSKALRNPLGFIVQLAGFNPTPAEEMGGELSGGAAPHEDKREQTQAQQRKLRAQCSELKKRGAAVPDNEPDWWAYTEKMSGEWFGKPIGKLNRGELSTLIERVETYIKTLPETIAAGAEPEQFTLGPEEDSIPF